MTDRPNVPKHWRAQWTSDIEDQYGRRSLSGTQMPAQNGPMYDPGGWGGPETPSLSSAPWRDMASNATAAANALMLSSMAPGWTKGLTMPIGAGLAGLWGFDAYRNAQQLNGEHPTQINQDMWADILLQALNGQK